MKRLKNEINSLVNRGVDRHLRLAVTGLSRSGKTAFITAMVNQLLNLHAGARLPLLGAVREERLLGVKRVPQRDFGIPRFTYDEGLAQLYGDPPAWPTPTRGVSEIRLALRFRSNESLMRHFKDTSTLYLEIVDYPGEWLLDLPMLAQDYLSWSRQMTGLLQGQRAGWSAKWRQLCEGLDPLAPADENRLAAIADAWTAYLHQCKQEGLHFIQPGRFVLPGDLAGAPALQFFPGRMWMGWASRSWRRRISTLTPVCCASVTITTVKKWSRDSIKTTFYDLTVRLCWWIVCSRSTAGRRHSTICALR
jgi:predicted YcjX-like family ATPase